MEEIGATDLPNSRILSKQAKEGYLEGYYPLAHRAKRGARVLISTYVESFYTRGD